MENKNKKTEFWLLMMKIFNRSCHQMPERSFFYKGYQFPVCARCTGIYLGYLLGIIAFLILSFVEFRLNIIIALLLVIPTTFDGFRQLIFKKESNNKRRFVTGLLAGIGFMLLTLDFAGYIFGF